MIRSLALLPVLLLAAAPVRAEVAVSILPLKGWAEELLGPGTSVRVLVGPGQSPALFEPTARQMTQLSGAEQFFGIGVPFEAALLPRLARMFPELEVVELGHGVERRSWAHGHGSGPDPHVWLDPALAAVLVDEMARALARTRPAEADGIAARAAGIRQRLDELDRRLRDRLAPLRGQTLLAYHPALGYFAAAYGLEQVSVESGGSEPGPRHLAGLAARVDAQSLRVLVVEPQFAPQRARAIAGTLGLEVLVFDPLAVDLVAELDRFGLALLAAAATGERP